MDNVNELKLAITGVIGILTSLWGWLGWLTILWFACMLLDYLTGTAAASKAGEWSSKLARDGVWHKLGSISAVLVAGILDLTLAAIIKNIPSIPFDFETLFAPLVMVWYILTECGSIVENAGKLGAAVPSWLAKSLAALKDTVDDTVDRDHDDDNEENKEA